MSECTKIAAIATAYYPFSHADVIISKFLKGFPADGLKDATFMENGFKA